MKCEFCGDEPARKVKVSDNGEIYVLPLCMKCNRIVSILSYFLTTLVVLEGAW